ncbi:MAG: VWA domain-containing protein [Pseudomonadota bacterium]
MKIWSRLPALFVMVTALSCAKVDQGPGATGTGGTAGPGSGGTVGGGGVGGGGVSAGTGGDMRGTTSGGGMGGEMSCGLERFDLERRPVEILVLLDRSASMARDSMDKDIPPGSTIVSKWNQIVPALNEVVGKIGGDISWGLKSFPEDGKECAQDTLTTKIDVPIAPMNAADIVAGVTRTTPAGNGTPTGATFEVATAHLRSRMNDHRKFILFATDGQPSCSGSVGSLALTGGGSMQAVGAATNGITAAAQAGIHTFVVGVATKETDTATLNAWAVAGMEARTDPNPLATKFYLGATKAELVNAFTTITNITQTCVFPLSKAPPVPTNIAVKVTGVKAPYDSASVSGWNYTDKTQTAVEVFGSWCDMVKTTAANKVEIIFGCPNIDIP